jgi:hypothetical protein
MMSELGETFDEAGEIALASTKAFGRTALFTVVPLFQFAALITIGILIVRIPAMLIREG